MNPTGNDLNLNTDMADALKIGEWMERGEFVHGLFNGRLIRKNLIRQASSLGIPALKQTYYAMIVAIDMRNGGDIPFGEQGPYKIWLERQIYQVTEEVSKQFETRLNIFFTVDVSPSVYALLTVHEAAKNVPQMIEELTDRILSWNQQSSDRIFTISLSEPRKKLYELSAAVPKVRDVLENRHNRALGILLNESEYQAKKPILDRISLPIGFLLFYVRSGDADNAEAEIRRIFKTFREEESLSLDSARIVTIELAITIFKANTTQENELVSYLYILNHIQKLNTLMEMEEEAARLAVQAAKHRVTNEDRRTRLAAQAVDYIHIHHADENLNLQIVANDLSVSVPYLTLIFREETGRPFSQHLREIRMERAKQLLLTTDASVSRIAKDIGYGSSQYFSTTFKKYTGMSPGRYRVSGVETEEVDE